MRQKLDTNVMTFLASHCLRVPDGSDKNIRVDARDDLYIFGGSVSKQCSICQNVDVDKRYSSAVLCGVGEVDRCGECQGSLASIDNL